MEPDRFDDVESTILEAPQPRERNPLRRRMALVMTLGLLAAGGLSAGASALTQSGEETAKAAPKVTRDADGWMRYKRDGHPCRRGEHHRSSSSELRY